MQVRGIDHVNIVTDRLEDTASFYTRLLGLERRGNIAVGLGFRGYWMHDADGAAIVHLVELDRTKPGHEGHETGVPTGAVHHVALRCSGLAETLARLEEMGVPYRVSEVEAIALTQVFARDPNNVLLELNFTAG